ncbi:hypothetical protein F1721_29650 [Saccharopolyspora hirsuta]|uniref:Uncharacterized protein n=1 Tax=Saccharopolyspora hirsuta TaxID=1837 RepID=A0A5M7BCK4_SACHI|nr:hypothetical protein [Saccharopolyspora hirsuta]KAA5827149.1 hypothetical protein F1721_29650 [Saccharopolyspora hirsuta]
MVRIQRRWKTAGTAALGTAAALVGTLLGPGSAAAAIDLSYEVSGTAHVVKMNADIPVEGVIDVQLSPTGEFTGKFRQTNVPRVKFKAFGAFDSEVDVEFFEAAPSRGKIENGQVDFELPLQIRLQNVTALGVPIGGGPDCVQQQPPSLVLKSTTPFVPAEGGELASAPYELSEWSEGCGPLTGLINMNSTGPDNTAEVKLTHVG